MAVHVGELHTDIVATESPTQSAAARQPGWYDDRRCLEAVERAAWQRARVSADGFDD